MVRRAIPLLLAAACAFDSSGQSGSADADGTSPGPSTTIMPSDGTSIASDVSNDGTQSDSSVTLDATTQGDSSITVDPTVSDATDVTDSTTEPTGDPTDATETTRGPTDESTTDPTRGDSSSGGGDDEEVCDGLDTTATAASTRDRRATSRATPASSCRRPRGLSTSRSARLR